MFTIYLVGGVITKKKNTLVYFIFIFSIKERKEKRPLQRITGTSVPKFCFTLDFFLQGFVMPLLKPVDI